ncbi:hypothetical protein BDZ97DRAFT_1920015 [Flammula alnicola]|nr:hypothetical protein BDZ97DRAFT_1920015 [Flammula alnicola]
MPVSYRTRPSFEESDPEEEEQYDDEPEPDSDDYGHSSPHSDGSDEDEEPSDRDGVRESTDLRSHSNLRPGRLDSDNSDYGPSSSEPNKDPMHLDSKSLPLELESAVREHVYNHMPIRVLLLPEMTLIERGAVVSHVMSSIMKVGMPAIEQKMRDALRMKVDVLMEGKAWAREAVVADIVQEHARYAILSHTWLQREPEVLYRDANEPQKWQSIRTRCDAGYRKLEGFCKVAREQHGVSLAWMDTICINKDSTSELDESIRSMYRWYCDSYICITYLADTTSLGDIPNDRWFTRGWTLQELLAPKRMKFYGGDWSILTTYGDDKSQDVTTRSGHHRRDRHRYFSPTTDATAGRSSTVDILQVIQQVTGIDRGEISKFQPGREDQISSQMAWAAKRVTTRGEDRAYSLMGIFNVSFSIAYGEGAERAFFRLIEAILASRRNNFDVLNCGGDPISNDIHPSRIIPSSPECYLAHSPRLIEEALSPTEPMTLTHRGLKLELLVVRAVLITRGKFAHQMAKKSQFQLLLSNSTFAASTRSSPVEVEVKTGYVRIPIPHEILDLPFVFGIWGFSHERGPFELPEDCPAYLFAMDADKKNFSLDNLYSVDISNAVRVTMERVVTIPRSVILSKGHTIKADSLAKVGMKHLIAYL